MPWVVFEPTISALKQAKAIHALDHAAAVIAFCTSMLCKLQWPRGTKRCLIPLTQGDQNTALYIGPSLHNMCNKDRGFMITDVHLLSKLVRLLCLFYLKTLSIHQNIVQYSRLIVWLSLTHSWSRALLEKLPIVQPLKNFPAFPGTRKFITAFTRAHHWSLSWARSIQSPPSLPKLVTRPNMKPWNWTGSSDKWLNKVTME
jgi:hypothetical protein